MKRPLLAILILSTATTVYCALRHATANLQQERFTQAVALQTQTQQLAQLRLEKQQIYERLSETRHWLAAETPLPALTKLAEKILSGASWRTFSDPEREQLLAELNFNWNTTGDYLIVSKKSLDGISFDGMKGAKLTSVVRTMLAITPTEQTAIETMTRELGEARAAWTKAHVQRTEPGGNVLAQYSLGVDQEFSQSQRAVFTNGIFSALGDPRGQWLQDHSSGWMTEVGLRTRPEFTEAQKKLLGSAQFPELESPPTTMTVERYKTGNEWGMNYTLKQAGNSMTTSVNPWQPFPEAFRPIFPGGWPDLAAREGFELPKEFKKKPAQ